MEYLAFAKFAINSQKQEMQISGLSLPHWSLPMNGSRKYEDRESGFDVFDCRQTGYVVNEHLCKNEFNQMLMVLIERPMENGLSGQPDGKTIAIK